MDYKEPPNKIIDTKNIVFDTMKHIHLGQIAELERLCFGDEAWSYMLMLGELSDDKKHYFVALSDDDVVGYVGYAHILDEAHIMNVAVKEDWRKKGIGNKLLECLLEDSKKREIRFATLEVNINNTDAITLYEKKGFSVGGIRKNYYRNTHDALIYWKEL